MLYLIYVTKHNLDVQTYKNFGNYVNKNIKTSANSLKIMFYKR